MIFLIFLFLFIINAKVRGIHMYVAKDTHNCQDARPLRKRRGEGVSGKTKIKISGKEWTPPSFYTLKVTAA